MAELEDLCQAALDAESGSPASMLLFQGAPPCERRTWPQVPRLRHQAAHLTGSLGLPHAVLVP